MSVIKIPGQENMYRDMKTGAVLYDNKLAIEKGKQIKASRKLEKEKLEKLENEVQEIKMLLKQLIEKGNE
jgi:hypothetical protein